MNELPGWTSKRIVDLISGDVDYRGKTPPKAEKGIPCISAANVKGGTVAAGDKFVSEKVYKRWTTRGFIKPGDVLITTEAPVAEVAQVPADQTYLITRRVIALQVDRHEADEAFLKYALLDDTNKRRLEVLSHGATVPRLYKEDILEFELLCPPLPTQRKIAAVLSAYDDLIENNTRRIAVLEQMARLLYQEWFVHFRFPGHEDVAMVDSDLGPVPEGWEVKELGEIAEQVRRNVKPDEVDPATPYIGLGHMPKRSIALSDWGRADETKSTKLMFERGEILFGKIRPYFHKVGVAPVDGVSSTDAIVIVPKPDEYFSLVLACVSSDEFVDHATQTSRGTKMPRADWNVLVKYPVYIPPEPILSRFSELTEAIVDHIQNTILRNRTLRRTRDLLLPRLVSGQVDVSELEIDVGAFEQ
jgi:type I restriction enzyme S subunit